MAYKGLYTIENKKKYTGDPFNVVYRSLWEREVFKWCDRNPKIKKWSSEEIIIPYRSPLDNRIHRYFVDFYIKVKDVNGNIQKYLIEVKPKKQTREPKVQKRMTKKYIYEVTEYAKNQAKWSAAKEFCEDRNYKFMLITEDELKV